jgi:integrase/recombinase XerD
MASSTTSIILDTRRPLKNGTFPVKLRITFLRERKYYPTAYSLSEEDFLKTQDPKARAKFKDLSIEFQAEEQRAIAVINKLPSFSFYEFEKKFLGSGFKNNVFSAFDYTILQLNDDGRVGTANSYTCASNSLYSFIKKEPLTQNKGMSKEEIAAKKEAQSRKAPLPFTSITVTFLKEYEKWMLAQAKSRTTIGIYLRPLRALFNEAIAAGDLTAEQYPFGKRKYQIPAGRNVKKALKIQEIKSIFDYEPKHDGEAKWRDLWLFSYLASGINIKDISRLKYKSIDNEKITFIRAKTERTTQHDLKPIVVMLTPEIKEIIERWGNKPVREDEYVFPILTEGLSPIQELGKVRQATKTLNKYIKKIASELGIEKEVTSYTARHSYSTVLKRAGVSTAFISESLGHKDEKTTQNYLDSFEDEVKIQYASLLTSF